MKKIALLFCLCMFVFMSCDEENDFRKNNSFTIENIAKKYNYKITESKINHQLYTVNNLNELNNLLLSIQNNFKIEKIQAFPNGKKNSSLTSKNSEYGEDPPYTYTTTVYFDNTFPSANVYVTINYNTNQAGEIIAAEVTSGSYGTFFGNTYTQTNVNATLQNGIFVFRITGQFTTSVGVGSFSLTGTNTAYYTGQFNLWRGNAGGSSGWVKQEAQNGTDQTELQDY